MNLQPLDYEAGGQCFSGWVVDGARGALGPGVLVIHEGGGLARHTQVRAARLAELGYVAYAMDLFGEVGLPLDRARAIVQDLRADIPRLRYRCRAALERLAEWPSTDAARLAAIGHCFGGAAAIELARDGAPLAATVVFHSGFMETPSTDEDRAISGKILICHGANDPAVTAEQANAFAARMEAAGVDWQLNLYGGVGHSFTNPDIDAWNLAGFAYHEAADRRSWAAMRALFDEVL